MGIFSNAIKGLITILKIMLNDESIIGWQGVFEIQGLTKSLHRYLHWLGCGKDVCV